jgi:hypothetical protein
MDPVALTLESALRRAGILAADAPGHVATFKAFEVAGDVERDERAAAARRALGNEVIETVGIDAEGLPYAVPAARARPGRRASPARGGVLRRITRCVPPAYLASAATPKRQP